MLEWPSASAAKGDLPPEKPCRGFSRRPSGRPPVWRRQVADPAPGCIAHGYETVSGRPFWLSRDPIGEDGGVNLYGMVGNDGINGIDLLGLVNMELCCKLRERLKYYFDNSLFGKPEEAYINGLIKAMLNGGKVWTFPDVGGSSVPVMDPKTGKQVIEPGSSISDYEFLWGVVQQGDQFYSTSAVTNRRDGTVSFKSNPEVLDALGNGALYLWGHNHPSNSWLSGYVYKDGNGVSWGDAMNPGTGDYNALHTVQATKTVYGNVIGGGRGLTEMYLRAKGIMAIGTGTGGLFGLMADNWKQGGQSGVGVLGQLHRGGTGGKDDFNIGSPLEGLKDLPPGTQGQDLADLIRCVKGGYIRK